MRWFWATILLLSVIAIGWNIYNIVIGVKHKVQWWMILLSSLGLLGALNGLNSASRNLFKL